MNFRWIGVALIVAVSAGCVTPPEFAGPITVTQTYDFDASAQELWTAANLWIAESFNSAEAVIEFSDRDAAVIAGRATTEFTWENPEATEFGYSGGAELVSTLRFYLAIEGRDGAMRVTFSQLEARAAVNPANSPNPFSPLIEEQVEGARAELGMLLNSLRTFVAARLSESW